MLGTTPKFQAAPGGKRARRRSEKSLDFHVSLPAGSDDATARLARKIRESIARTIEREANGEGRVVISDEAAPAADDAGNVPARETPTGCGAWWAF